MLKARDLRQIVAYALLDWTDSYGIGAVGILAARQGALVTWPLGDLFTAMAGEPVDVAELRIDLRNHLAATDPWSVDDDV